MYTCMYCTVHVYAFYDYHCLVLSLFPPTPHSISSPPFSFFLPLLSISSPSPLPPLPPLPLPAPPSPLPSSSSLQIQELEDEVEELRSRLKETQESLERETLAKVDLQNQIQSLREELAFKKKVYDEVWHCYHGNKLTTGLLFAFRKFQIP